MGKINSFSCFSGAAYYFAQSEVLGQQVTNAHKQKKILGSACHGALGNRIHFFFKCYHNCSKSISTLEFFSPRYCVENIPL